MLVCKGKLVCFGEMSPRQAIEGASTPASRVGGGRQPLPQAQAVGGEPPAPDPSRPATLGCGHPSQDHRPGPQRTSNPATCLRLPDTARARTPNLSRIPPAEALGLLQILTSQLCRLGCGSGRLCGRNTTSRLC